MEAHPTGAAIPSPMAAPQPPPSSTTTPLPTATPQEPAATAVTAVRSPQPVRFAFLVVAALMSASWFVEPFSAAAAAADLRVPWSAVVATLVCFTALFCASVLLFGSFFMLRPPLAAAVMAAQWKGVRAFAAVFAAVVIGVAACLVGASGSGVWFWRYAPTRC